MKRRVFLILSAMIVTVVSGCGSVKSNAKYRVVVIPKGLTHEFWQSIHRGAERAGADLKDRLGLAVDVKWDGPLEENETQAQLNIIDRNLAGKISGIVLAPQHSQALIPSVENAIKQGVPVLIIDSGLASEADKLIVKYVATDNYHGGRLAGEHLIKVLREAGNPAPRLVLFRYQIGSESTEQREKGFEDYVNSVIEEQKKAGKPTITWLSTDHYAGATEDSAMKEAGPLLNRLRDKQIDAIFAPNESSAAGMLASLRSLQMNKKVKLVGFDSSAPLVDALREGDVEALILQDPYRMGYLGVWTLVQYLEGYDVCPDGKHVQSTGENVITRANINDVATRQLFDPELQASRKIEAPTFTKKR
ncbi:MAG TPA: substrate-binding domain-containing protein [Gemmataceae bacterium]|nr:substrate-binding domain-containing protein [Gemmataceae bacterium]